MSKEWEPETIFDVFGSERAREILAMASVEPMSAQEFADRTGASLPTIYRRINALQEYDLLEEQTEIDKQGNHYKTFETNLEEVCFQIEDGSFTVDLRLRHDLVDKFDELWGDLESGQEDENS